MQDYPVYEALVGDDTDTGVSKVSLVSEPAIMVDFVALRRQGHTPVVVRQDRQMVYGPLLIPEQKIARQNIQGAPDYSADMPEAYYIKYSSEVIEEARDKFASGEKFSTALNLQHGAEKVDGVIVEQWIVEGDQDKSRALGFDLPPGTWMAGVRIKDEKFWKEKIKSEEIKGFSIEGAFQFAPVKQQARPVEVSNKLYHDVEPDTKTLITQFNNYMSKFTQLLGLQKAQVNQMGDYDKEKQAKDAVKQMESVMIETDDGPVMGYIAKNGAVTLINPETGAAKVAPDGSHTTTDGTSIEVKDGKIVVTEADQSADVAEPPAQAEAQPQTETPQPQPQGATEEEESKTMRIGPNGQLIAPDGYEIQIGDDGTPQLVKVQQAVNSKLEQLAEIMLQSHQRQEQERKQMEARLKAQDEKLQKLMQQLQKTGVGGFIDFSDTQPQTPESTSKTELSLQEALRELDKEKAKPKAHLRSNQQKGGKA